MKTYIVSVVDSLTTATISFRVYGKMTVISINNKMVSCIVNEYNTPLFIETISTISIKEK